MILSPNYEIVEIADELIAVPIGDLAAECKDVFTFSKAASLLIKKLATQTSSNELVDLLVDKYDIDLKKAHMDVQQFIILLQDNGLIAL